ncbi:MAG: hypothetical protein QGH83_05850, partial [Candidatus Pacebacteria bacterium]|nr:hypothetical protein [Candidatus Paceibacterota bacterium]
EEMKKLPAKSSDKKLIANTIKDRKFKAAIREELTVDEEVKTNEGLFGRTLKKKSYSVAVGYYKKFRQRGDSSGVALHKAASMIQGLNDRDLNLYLQKNKVL